MGGFQGQATDIEIHAREILRMRSELNQILQKHTGQPLERIEADTERDYFMSGEEAAGYGLIDKVISAGTFLGRFNPKHTLRCNAWPWTTTKSNGLPAKTESEEEFMAGRKGNFSSLYCSFCGRVRMRCANSSPAQRCIYAMNALNCAMK